MLFLAQESDFIGEMIKKVTLFLLRSHDDGSKKMIDEKLFLLLHLDVLFIGLG